MFCTFGFRAENGGGALMVNRNAVWPATTFPTSKRKSFYLAVNEPFTKKKGNFKCHTSLQFSPTGYFGKPAIKPLTL